ncbi:glycoside hydrolase family 88 protein [Vagococcus fluvialis]|uniref:glycoside hydrolase family 88 protein n=1 Tax=Vagococcus fluvialis TaxID=2738 RepID=UPI001A90C47F|nr:glycoside hydrolase family 88 protein [Vagococcus fluvialis]MBO0438426.1 glycoside hydrolase family 88 protein [Vagococcus fluvialis]
MLEKKLIELESAGEKLTEQWLQDEIKRCINQIEKNMGRFEELFPSASAVDGVYKVKPNDDWTNGFWTGMLWLAYEWTNDSKFLDLAQKNFISFQERLDSHFVLDHHDIGFLYSLSAGAGYKLTNEEKYADQLLEASNVLLNRFQAKGEFIQAWGKYGDPNEYRLIIDSLINLPLLFEATNLSNNSLYQDLALKHYKTLLSTVIRPDFTTYHTYYFDSETGDKIRGATHQGNSDNSIWARGQSWAVLGIPLIENHLKSKIYSSSDYIKIVNVFLENLPLDLVPYWDFDFNDQNPSTKDSSSLAIAACGLLEAEEYGMYPKAKNIAKGMIYQLGEYYSTENEESSEGLITEGVYAFKTGKGVGEPNLWGDYFYLEALMRLSNEKWNKYW